MDGEAVAGQQTDREVLAGTRTDVMLDELGDSLKNDEAKRKKEAEDKERRERLAEEIKLRQEAGAGAGSDERASRLEQALRISEDARRRAEEIARISATAPAPKVDEPKELTREELAELHTKDPIAALEYVSGRQTKILAESISRRLDGLAASGYSSARQAAEIRHADTFALLGPEINALIDTLPNKNALASAKDWDDLVAYVTGKNVTKVLEHERTKSTKKAEEDARARQVAAAGPGAVGKIRGAAPVTVDTLDATQKEIAKAMGISEEEYAKWARVGQ